MRIIFWILTCVYLLLLTNAINAKDVCARDKGIEVKGTVVNFAGVPWEGAIIKLSSKELESSEARNKIEKETTTNIRGEYSFTKLPEGSYEVTLEPNGTGILKQTITTPIIFDGKSYEVDFGLEIGSIGDCPLHTVYGTVKDEKGKDIKGAKISVINAFNQRRILSSKTDDKGVYKIDLCNPGQYLIFANTPNYEVQVFNLTFPIEIPFKTLSFVLKPLSEKKMSR